jgi:arsenate reductase-like glutaredoxin family protein
MASHHVESKTVVDAKRVRLDEEAALQIARKATKLHVAKGKVTKTSATKGLSDEEILSSIMGPTGNLRAPTIIKKQVMLVGFHEELYAEVLGA